MGRLGLILCCALALVSGYAKDEFGPCAEAKSKHHEFFKPGAVIETLLGSEPWYVYCGDAEKCFSEETDSELFQEAEVQAKSNFYEHFVKLTQDRGVKVTVQRARRMYQCADGKMRYVVMGVPKSGVAVSAQSQKPVAPTCPRSDPIVKTNKEQSPCLPASASYISSEKVPDDKPVTPAAEKVEEKNKDGTTDTAMSEEEKLNVLRARLERRPGDFHTRIRMARIFKSQGKTTRALRNYYDAARLIILDEYTSAEDKVDDLREVAEFEESVGAGSFALKHYRAIQRFRIPEHAKYATQRISDLLLHYE